MCVFVLGVCMCKQMVSGEVLALKYDVYLVNLAQNRKRKNSIWCEY